MKLINSRGRILLEVTAADAELVKTASGLQFRNILYSYKGDSMGGYTTLAGLHAVISCVKRDNPSARIEGLLPEPTIRERHDDEENS